MFREAQGSVVCVPCLLPRSCDDQNVFDNQLKEDKNGKSSVDSSSVEIPGLLLLDEKTA